MSNDSGIDWNEAVRNTITLHPEKFGVMGQYSRELLEASEAREYMSDMLMVRLTTAVLCGRTISKNPKVVLNQPKNCWQHVKHQLHNWEEDKDAHWQGYDRNSAEKVTPPPWLILLWPLLWLIRTWMGKRPVKYNTITADIHFEQHILYPEIDVPAHAGRPVIYETLDVTWGGDKAKWGSSVTSDPSRFLPGHEIARAVYRDPELNRFSGGASGSPDVTLEWLRRHGVNVDQLVRREGIR